MVFKLVPNLVKNRSNGRGRRFPLWLGMFALHLNLRGPQAYPFLLPNLSLPSRRTLRRSFSKIKMAPGIIPGIMSSISTRTHSWNKSDRVFTHIFDRIVLKKDLSYDITQAVVQGFTGDGIERTPTIADKAMVVLLYAISKTWVQPVAYTTGHISRP